MKLNQWKREREARRRAGLDYVERGRKQAVIEHFPSQGQNSAMNEMSKEA